MINSETRIEVAELMRGSFDVYEDVGRTYITGNIFGMQMCAGDEPKLRNGMRYLADLIDPTCKIDSVEPIEYGEFNQTIGYDFNLTCGHSVMRPYMDMPPAYCDECGARVVSDNGK